ncbi:MAG: protein kinase [Magnetococcales bacterium]|nr:serine/threonine protein kinase [Magnetococcales bacterium]NGZ26821.1 protein kinase [Magnetococcales bacterium]
MSDLEKLGKYQIRRVLGKGAMGVVYEGFDPGIERVVAIKTIHKALLEGEGGAELLARFKREAQAAGRLMHPNIVAIYEYGEDQGIPFIAMEFIKGKELKDLIKDKARFTTQQVTEVMTQILDAMQYVHSNGVVHRDMKPANIVILENGQVKVADFGIARVESSTMTQMGAVMGTPSYMSPEQFMGQRVDARADLFSIGVILYELLTGEKPFPGQAVATIMQKVLNAPVEPPTSFNFDIPDSFNALVRKALAKRPSERFQSAKEFADALKLAAQGKYGEGEANAASAEGTMVVGGQSDADATAMIPSAPPKSDATISAPHAAPTRAAAPQAAPPPPPAAEKKSSMGLIIGGVVGLLVLGGGGAYMATKKSSDVQPGGTGSSVKPETTMPAPKPRPPAKNSGKVNVISSPAGAVILVDDQFIGVTPYEFDLAAGTYKFVLKKDGFTNLEASLEVESGGKLDLDVALEPK